MTRFDERDKRAMARALALAEKGLYTTHPNPRVGCVLMQGDTIVGEGWHQRAGEPHAEVHALRAAGEQARGATAYVTLEPCSHHGRTPPCADALLAAGVSQVVVAVDDPNPQVAGGGLQRLRAAGVNVRTGLMREEATWLNRGFLSRMSRSRPWLRLKLAASCDGRSAMASGESQWITGPAARRDTQYLRAQADCIATGVGTLLADDPLLNVRLSPNELAIEGAYVQPARLLLDSHWRGPLSSRWYEAPGRRWVAACRESPASLAKGCELLLVATNHRNQVDLHDLLARLGEREINEVHLECGPVLAAAALQAGVVDEVVLYQAPKLLGAEARPVANLLGLESLSEALTFRFQDVRQIGDDLRLVLISTAAGAE